MATQTRREILGAAGALGAATLLGAQPSLSAAPGDKMRLGLVTYLWGQDWDLPTLIANCEKSNMAGVELRVDHAHNVSPSISKAERAEVKKRFADSPVTCVGMGCNEQFDNPDPARVIDNIERSIQFLRLSRDIGGTGVKVKPNQFHDGVPHEQTCEQIGKALNILGNVASDMGQVIRLEVHGNGTQDLPNIKMIMDACESRSVGVCWNCNGQDLDGQGLEHNFNLVKDRFGDTVHIRELNIGDYPYQDLMKLFVGIDYDGWILLEARTKPADRVVALKEQLDVFNTMIANARK